MRRGYQIQELMKIFIEIFLFLFFKVYLSSILPIMV